MLQHIVAVVFLGGYRLRLRFEGGATGDVDISQCVKFTGVFAPLKDRAEFAAVRVDPEHGTVRWPCGADFDPDVLYAAVTGKPLPSFGKAKQAG